MLRLQTYIGMTGHYNFKVMVIILYNLQDSYLKGKRTMVIIIDLDMTQELKDIFELEAFLRRRNHENLNAFKLHHGNVLFPMLDILVKGELAALHYFVEGDDAGYCSTGNKVGLNLAESTSFSISENHGDDVEVLNDAILPFADAVTAAKEFFFFKGLPESIQWLKL